MHSYFEKAASSPGLTHEGSYTYNEAKYTLRVHSDRVISRLRHYEKVRARAPYRRCRTTWRNTKVRPAFAVNSLIKFPTNFQGVQFQ
jgi:hypothetical protein